PGPRVVLAGHLDTVPPNGNERPVIRGDVLAGLGAADMKGGLAVMVALAERADPPRTATSWVFYAAEEVARVYSGLLAVAAARPDLLAGDVAILGEPTGSVVEAGCQGVLKADVTVTGSRAHTARPWTGVNAVHRLGPVIERVAQMPDRRPVLDGCEYREALQAVGVSGGVAANVVPDRATLQLNHRFAPDREPHQAEQALRALLAPVLDEGAGDRLEVTDQAPAAPPSLDHPVLSALVAATGAPARAKLGWTDVAFFAERGTPAANFGPGDPLLAHRPDEQVTAAELAHAHRVLADLLWGG
ncbi:MAG TPA: succinyl-diaminopimelate desuccinylase, partial [Acidimicrobiales bacterium]|nr:succinyl-diaminopimelate desuccinylase [Acidimicrobiales bacterium]